MYFDDFNVEQSKSPLIESADYYPGGAMFNNYQRENSVDNRYHYQSKEWITELGLDQYDIEWRRYDPWLWRTPTIDPLADWFYEWSPYSWAGNNPMLNIDPTGQDWYKYTNEDGKESVIWQEGDAGEIEIDGATYSNIGSVYEHTTDEGITVIYEQNEVVNVIDRNETAENYDFGKGMDVQHVDERTNKVINDEIKNFTKSLVGQGDPNKGPVWEQPITPFDKRPGSRNLGARKGSNKNSKHANENRRQQARQNYEQSKKEYEELKSKPNKTPDDKKKLEQAKRKMEHHKKQMDFTGENHSQTGKGN